MSAILYLLLILSFTHSAAIDWKSVSLDQIERAVKTHFNITSLDTDFDCIDHQGRFAAERSLVSCGGLSFCSFIWSQLNTRLLHAPDVWIHQSCDKTPVPLLDILPPKLFHITPHTNITLPHLCTAASVAKKGLHSFCLSGAEIEAVLNALAPALKNMWDEAIENTDITLDMGLCCCREDRCNTMGELINWTQPQVQNELSALEREFVFDTSGCFVVREAGHFVIIFLLLLYV